MDFDEVKFHKGVSNFGDLKLSLQILHEGNPGHLVMLLCAGRAHNLQQSGLSMLVSQKKSVGSHC